MMLFISYFGPTKSRIKLTIFRSGGELTTFSLKKMEENGKKWMGVLS